MIGIIGAIVGDLIGQSYEFQSTKDYKYIETNLKEVAFDISLLDKENYWENLI